MPRFVQSGRLHAQLAPLATHAVLNIAERQQPRRTVLPRRAHVALRRPALLARGFAEHRPERLRERVLQRDESSSSLSPDFAPRREVRAFCCPTPHPVASSACTPRAPPAFTR